MPTQAEAVTADVRMKLHVAETTLDSFDLIARADFIEDEQQTPYARPLASTPLRTALVEYCEAVPGLHQANKDSWQDWAADLRSRDEYPAPQTIGLGWLNDTPARTQVRVPEVTRNSFGLLTYGVMRESHPEVLRLIEEFPKYRYKGEQERVFDNDHDEHRTRPVVELNPTHPFINWDAIEDQVIRIKRRFTDSAFYAYMQQRAAEDGFADRLQEAAELRASERRPVVPAPRGILDMAGISLG